MSMTISSKELHQKILAHENITLIDVRTPVEFSEMHIENSILMPLDKLDPVAVAAACADSSTCVLICHGGKRAKQAHTQLTEANCKNLLILTGGVTAWQDSKLPLIRSEKKRLPLMRQVHLTIGLSVLVGSILALTQDVRFAYLTAFFGAGLTMAGATGWCGLAMLLSKMPWNRCACSCDKNSCSVEKP